MRDSRVLVCSWCAAALAAVAVQAGETLTYVDLIQRLADLEAPAVLPAAGETCRLWSSYDRASQYDAQTGKYLNWSANNDGDGIVRREGNLAVLAEMEGPGVIWRIWSARTGDGHVKILLDGAETPAVDLPFKQYFDGSQPPFQGRVMRHGTAWGSNCYVPIPFQKSCKIVAEDGWGQYYQFTCATYPKGTVLPTFTRNLTAAETQAMARVDAILDAGRGEDPAGARPGSVVEERTLTLAPGQTVRAAELSGRRAITALKVKVDVPSRSSELLREVCLRITWDDEPAPAVWSPLGDFFGSAPGVNLYRSLPLGMTTNGFYSFWYMPFAKRATIELTNEGQEARTLQFTVCHAPLTRPVKSLARFHAKWHLNAFPPANPDRGADWTLLKTQGRGRFLGVMLNVWCPIGGSWWEGDEKFFVDGERFPSSFGTGTEDYFGYAWVRPDLFDNAYHNQTRNDDGNKGHISVNRWQIADNVPFQTDFEGVIEKYAGDNESVLYAATAYWYQQAGQTDPYLEVPVRERTGWHPPTAVLGVIAGQESQLKQIDRTGGDLRRQDLSAFGTGWRGGDHAWWTGAKPGDRLVLELPVHAAGPYRLRLNLTRSWDYGMVQVTLDGQKLGAPQDLFSGKLEAYGVDLGVQDLTPGEHKLGFEIAGRNDRVDGGKYLAGIDYVELEPVTDAER